MDGKWHQLDVIRDLRREGQLGALGAYALLYSQALADPDLDGIVLAEDLGSAVEHVAARRLVSAGLFAEVPGGFRIVDWPDPPQIDPGPGRSADAELEASVGQRPSPAAAAAWAQNLPGGLEGVFRPGPDNDNVPAELAGRGDMLRQYEGADAARPEEVIRCFQRCYLAKFGQLPYLGGKNTHDFPERLRGTARLRHVDPLQLLEQVFAAWAQAPLDDRALDAPYAAFAARFGSLVGRTGSAQSPAERLKRQLSEALAKGDRQAYDRLNAEYQTAILGGRSAKPAI